MSAAATVVIERPHFSIDKMQALVLEMDRATEQARNEEIIVIAGFSRAGKSTTIKLLFDFTDGQFFRFVYWVS